MTNETKNLGGRPQFQPTEQHRKTVKAMAAYGILEIGIAKVIGISVPTMRKYFWNELDTGHIEANAKVAESLFQRALGPGKEGVTACIFWLKCRAGWRERDHEPYEGKKEQAIAVAQTAERGTNWDSIMN